MQYINLFNQKLYTAFSGGLLGVLFLILTPVSTSAFQVDSLQLTQSLDGLAQSILKFADYDTDGDLDLIIAGTNNSSVQVVRLYKNNGSGTFSEDHNSSITGFNYPGLSWGDVDGDGDLDFVVSGNTSTGYQAKLYLNNGSAVFAEAASDPFYDAYWGNMELGDLDNDGDLDVFQTGLQANGSRVAEIFWNDGKGAFTNDTNNSFTGTGDGETPLADLDNDGDLDILLSGYIDAGGNITQVHLNDGTGTFTLSQSLQGVASNGMDFGDYDNDGDLDLILTGRDYSGGARRAYIYENNGSGSFTIDSTNTIAPVSYSNAKWGDYDHDGDLDVILSGFGDGGFRETYIYTNDGTGIMSYTSNSAITGSEEGYVDWADLDGDGFLEVAITGWDGSNRMTKIYQNIRTTSNSAPSVPANLLASVEGDTVSFSWDASTDADGGSISYALFLHNGDSSRFLIPAYSDTTSGFRQINRLGNSGLIRTLKIDKSNIPYGTYSWGVEAIDAAGKNSSYTKSSFSVSPQIPNGLSVTRNELTASLTWAPNQTDSLAYYIIYKEDNNSGQIDSLGFSSDTTFTYSGLSYGNTYDFYVATKTTTGFTSDRSNSVEVVVPALTAPSSLAYTRNDLSIDLNWDAYNDVSVDYYIIYKEDNNSGQIDSLGFSNTSSFTYPGLNYGNTYDFYIATKTTTGFTSDRSDSVEVSTPVLTSPTGLILTQNKLVAELIWEANTLVSVDYYIIYKEENNSGQIDSLGFSNDTSFNYSGLNDGTTYDFYVATKTTSGFKSTRSDSVELTVDYLRYSLESVDPQGNQEIGSLSSIYTFDFADYDLDGDYDMLAIGNDTVSGVQLRVFDNDGAGNFSSSGFLVTTIDDSDPTYPSVKWVDANLDNYPDVFYSGYSTGGRTRIYLNNGDGTFTDSNQQLIDTWSKDAYLWMDFDTDGDDDLLLYGSEVLNSSNQFTLLYLNDGYGNFSVEDSSLFMTEDQYPALFGPFERYDYDNDRDYDLIAHTSESIIEIHIFENQGGLNFVRDNSVPFESVTADAIEIADANNDGYMDIMFAGKDDAEDPITLLYLNNSTGNNYSTGLIKYTGYTFPGVEQSDIQIRDLNNDGANEFILVGDSSGVAITRVYSNLVETTGIFEIAPANIFEDNDDELPQVFNPQIQVLDLDNDNDLDIFLKGYDDPVAPLDSYKYFLLENTVATEIPLVDNTLVYTPSASIVNDSLKIGGLPSYPNYSFYLYNTDISKYFITPKANINNGYRLFPGRSGYEFFRHFGDYDTDIELNHTFKRNYLPGGNYVIGIQGIDDVSGIGSAFKTTTVKFGPLAPQNLVIASDSINRSVSLTWNQNPGTNTTKYVVFQTQDTLLTATSLDLSNKDYSSIIAGETTDTTITINNITPDTTFYYTVGAFTDDIEIYPNYSELSAIDSVNIPFIPFATSANSVTGIRLGATEFGDYDNDGDLDLLVTGDLNTSSGYSKIYDNNAGTYTENNSISIEALYNSDAKFADYDRDGDLDFALTGLNTSSATVTYIYTNDGAGGFSNTSTLQGVQLGSIDWADIDGDGDLDLAISGFANSPISTPITYLFLNNGSGTFSQHTSLTGTFRNDLEFVDFDNDGDNDLFLTGVSDDNNLTTSGVTIVYENDGFATFTQTALGFTNMGQSSGGWGDFNNDGHYDLALMGLNSSGTPTSAVYTNDGDGTFTALTSSIDSLYSGDITVGDIDNDGDSDLILIGLDGSGIRNTVVYVNDGSGTFTKRSNLNILVGLSESTSEIVDVDQDGDLDFMISGLNNASSTQTILYINQEPSVNSAPGSPSNLAVTLQGEDYRFSWDAADDSENGPVAYNVFVQYSDSSYFVRPESAIESGVNRLQNHANAGLRQFYTIEKSALQRGEYRFGVQAVDASGGVSTFSDVDSVLINQFLIADSSPILTFEGITQSISSSSFQLNEIVSDTNFTFSTTTSFNGTLFIDANSNDIFDEGEQKVDTTGISFALLNSDTLKVTSAFSGFQNTTFKITSPSGLTTDSVTIQIYSNKGNPEISGIADQGGWYLLSNPLQTTIGTLFENIWTQGAVNADSESGSPNIYTFNVDSAKYIAVTTDLDTTNVSAGEGILVYIFPDDNYDDAKDPVNGGWPKTLSNYGSPFGENISIPIKNTDVDGNGFTSGSEGFQLMGNPYGFPVSIDSLVAEMVKVDPIANRYIYRWDPVNKQYNLNFTGKVEAYESFFVRTVQSGVSGSASFDYDDVHSSARLKSHAPNYPIELELTAGDLTSSMYSIRLAEDADIDIDPLDGYYLGSFASSFANLYSSIGDQPLVLNNLPIGLAEIVEIPLFLHSTESGEHTLEWNLSDLPEEWSIELMNPATGEMLDMKEETKYSFEYEKLQFKQVINQSPNLFGFHTNLAKKKTNSSNLLLRINPGLSTHGENGMGIPREVELDQNYPNPFNPTSIIRFGVPNTAKVQLEVFDILGRKVATLLNNETKQPGRYNVQFNANNLASGMYIYRLVIGDKVLTKKMTLIK